MKTNRKCFKYCRRECVMRSCMCLRVCAYYYALQTMKNGLKMETTMRNVFPKISQQTLVAIFVWVTRANLDDFFFFRFARRKCSKWQRHRNEFCGNNKMYGVTAKCWYIVCLSFYGETWIMNREVNEKMKRHENYTTYFHKYSHWIQFVKVIKIQCSSIQCSVPKMSYAVCVCVCACAYVSILLTRSEKGDKILRRGKFW